MDSDSDSVIPPTVAPSQMLSPTSLDPNDRPSQHVLPKAVFTRYSVQADDLPSDSDSQSHNERQEVRLAVSEDENSSPWVRRRRRILRGHKSRPSKSSVLLDTTTNSVADRMPAAARIKPRTSLTELSHLIRLQRQQQKKSACSRTRLHRLLVAHCLCSRLVRCGKDSWKDLCEALKTGDKRRFTALHDTLHDLRTSLAAMQRSALLDPDLSFAESPSFNGILLPEPDSTFLHEIPTTTRDELLAFLSVLRSNPNFLTERIACLSTAEIERFVASHVAIDLTSVFAHPTARTPRTGSGANLRSRPSTGGVDRLLSFQRHDAFSAMFYSLFAGPSRQGSPEDVRRAEIWSTLCARLVVESKPGWEKLFHCILDAYAGLREWTLKHSLETFLVRILREGQFLMDRLEDHFARARALDGTLQADISNRRDRFLQSACEELFDLFGDDETTPGLPLGILEIVPATIGKLPDKKHRHGLQRFVVHRWFLGRFLPHAVVDPESHDLMRSYHVTDAARKSILQPLALEVQKYANDSMYKWQQTDSASPIIRSKIDLMLLHLKHAQPVLRSLPTTTGLMAPPSIVASSQPVLLLCAADIITMVNGLYPERRPPSGSFDPHTSFACPGWASTASSVSGSSAPFSASSVSGDASSVFSMSASSMTSDTTSRAPGNLGTHLNGSQPSLKTFGARQIHDVSAFDEEYGRRLRVACAEMTESLGPTNVAGSCHPCAEKWALLSVSPGGQSLTMGTDSVLEHVAGDSTDDDTSESESDAQSTSDNASLDYEELKSTVARLLEAHDVPHGLEPDIEHQPSTSATLISKNGSRTQRSAHRKDMGPTISDQQHIEHQPELHEDIDLDWNHGRGEAVPAASNSATRVAPLISMLQTAKSQCQLHYSFLNAHRYHRALLQLQQMGSSYNSLTVDDYTPLLFYMGRDARESLRHCANRLEEMNGWHTWIKQASDRSSVTMRAMFSSFKALRDRLWYAVDVRHSAIYEEARNVVGALKAMGSPWKSSATKPLQPKLRHTRPSSNNFVLRQEGQTLEVLAAPANMAGPNKLSDEQSILVERWLLESHIHNLCRGEERIHRFCYEIKRCANKLIGDGVLDAPELWSSELFQRDKSVYEQGFDQGELLLTGSSSTMNKGDWIVRPFSSNSHLSNSSQFDVYTLGLRNGSQSSFSSQESFRPLSPITIPTSIPSPLATTYDAPLSSGRFARPYVGTSRSPEPIARRFPMQQKQSDPTKRQFLQQLERRLVSLLLSDLAPGLFSAGCETDAWLFGDLGSALIARRTRGIGDKQHTVQEGSAEPTKLEGGPSLPPFAYRDASNQLLLRLSTVVDPFSKLDILHELQSIIGASLGAKSSGVIKKHRSSRNILRAAEELPTDAIVEQFKRLFSDVKCHQGTLFRDLQYIASFIPSSVLDKDPKGTAFWNAALAAQSLKVDVYSSMIEVSDSVVERSAERRAGHQQSAVGVPQENDPKPPAAVHQAQQEAVPSAETLSWANRLATFSMADAARMLIVAAKEGDAVAQRELGIMYLTHPELLPRTLLPFTPPKAVFKPELLGQKDRDSQRKGGQAFDRADPMAMCVAQHWMECSKRGGDQLAIEYLKARDEIERIP